ncbi:MAG: T9SS type A sorting domain-containing protein [Flavobacterium sp. JAD_PAG50586_2]|nr:MAG: T9SS type A sorting domain-containing protein [Flavobacterium sp. JAD_PAG50586_2]
MKKLLLSFALLTSLYGNSQILSEEFQGTVFPPTGWTTETNVPSRPWGFTTDIFNATGQATFNITGSKSAAIGWIAQDQDAHLTSPTFSLLDYSDATLTFNAKIGYEFMVDPNPNGDFNVEISDDGGSTFTSVWVEENYGLFVDYETLAISIDLAAYIGMDNLQVRFHYTGNDADSMSFDDVLITGTLGVNEALASKFNTYPNPANNTVNVSNNYNITLTNVNITDINGRTVKTMNVNNLSEVQMNVSDLNTGVYFMNIDTDSGKVVKKFIKV